MKRLLLLIVFLILTSQINSQNQNDLGVFDHNIFISESFSRPITIAQSASEFDVEPGGWVNNIGVNDQNNVTLTAKVFYNNNVIYNQTALPENIISGDSAFFSFPLFNQTNYQTGNYTLEYSINLGSSVLDDDTTNNKIVSYFKLSDSLFSYSRLNDTTHLPIASAFHGFNYSSFIKSCIHYRDSNASRVNPKGLTFSATSPNDLTGQYFEVVIFEWGNQFSDIYDPNYGTNVFLYITHGDYICPSDLQAENIYVPFDTTNSFSLNDNTRYLFCVQAYNPGISFGYDEIINYRENQDSLYRQPIGLVELDASGTYYWSSGNGKPLCPSISINMGTYCGHSAIINQSGPVTACLSDSIFLSCNTNSNFTYQWQLNGFPLNGATDTIFYPNQSGSYSVVISENNCPDFSTAVQVTIDTLSAPTISSSGTITPCLGGSVTLSVPSTYSSYSWSSGGTSSSEVVTSSGSYFVTISDSTGCEATSPTFTINASFATPPDVCIVGVDSITNYNKVVWEKPISSAIDSFYVYKETNQANIYQKIGGTSYSDTAVFNDLSSNPSVQAYRYKLSLVDSCGVESSLGSMHKSIHLTINQGVGITWNLIWSHYEGFIFPSYNIYRGTSSTNMTLLTTIASNLNSYTDLTAPAGQLYYQIEVVSNYTCDPLKSTYNTSRSNIVDNAQTSVIVQSENSNVNAYPNPTHDQITIDIKGYNVDVNVEVYDLSGRLLKSTNNTTISLKDYAKGIYVFRVAYGDIVEELKVVKE